MRRAHGAHGLAKRQRAPLGRAAECVVAQVAERREKLVHQVAVRRVNLDDVETGGDRACGPGDEGVDDLAHLACRQGARISQPLECDRRGRDCWPAAFADRHRALGGSGAPGVGRGLAAGVRELNADLCAVRVCELHDTLECLLLRVVPEAEVVRRDAPLWHH